MKITEQDKQFLREQYQKVWHNDKKMIEYEAKTAHSFLMLHGRLLVFKKPGIKTDFCFGERGYDYDEVQHTCAALSKDEAYFIQENINNSFFGMALKYLNDDRFTVTINPKEYWRQDEDCLLSNLEFYNPYDNCRSENEIQLTEDDLSILKDFIFNELEAFKKRLNTYLKRYGLSKCRYWTYWMDA